MIWRIEFTRQARKDISGMDAAARRRIVRALEALALDPQGAANVKALKGEPGYRLRVGDYRVIYELNGDTLLILVLRARHRREVYR